jgi:predicted phage tail protein
VRTLRLHGRLAELVGASEFKIAVKSVAESIRFLVANFPALEPWIAKQSFHVTAGSIEIIEESLHYPVGSDEEINLTPVIAGAGAVGRIILGTVLIAASFLIPGAALFGVGLAPIAFGIGASLVLGGVSQLLTPTPNTNLDVMKDPKTLESFSFGGIQNVSRQGVPVPIGYGECIVGSVTISSGLDTVGQT